jgi:lactate permease
VRVQTLLFAWAFGALLEGLVGFGYPWAFVAPILISLGIPDLDAIRVAAIANNAPVSYGALGAPIIALAAVTGLPLLQLSGSVGHVVAVLALLPPWILIYLVSGKKGFRDGWPLAVVGSLGYIAGQFPVAVYLGPYLPDVAGAIICFAALLILLQFWQPKTVLGYGGVPVPKAGQSRFGGGNERLKPGDVFQAWLPFIVLVITVVLWTGPWSLLPKYAPVKFSVDAGSSIAHGVFIFGLAFVFNFSGMAGSLAFGFSKIGPWFIIVSPILGWIGVALSGSNTSTNAMFGAFQTAVGKMLGLPPLLLPTLNSVGSEVGKPVAPQTASVGVSTSRFVRNEGAVIRHNMAWTLILLIYLILIGILFYLFFPRHTVFG